MNVISLISFCITGQITVFDGCILSMFIESKIARYRHSSSSVMQHCSSLFILEKYYCVHCMEDNHGHCLLFRDIILSDNLYYSLLRLFCMTAGTAILKCCNLGSTHF
jgi:hypothetical protein